MGWLSGWSKRIKITVDNTYIDNDLTHFPIPILLGESVGQTNIDVSDIFDVLGVNSKKIAVTKSDGLTQLYVEIERWNSIEYSGYWAGDHVNKGGAWEYTLSSSVYLSAGDYYCTFNAYDSDVLESGVYETSLRIESETEVIDVFSKNPGNNAWSPQSGYFTISGSGYYDIKGRQQEDATYNWGLDNVSITSERKALLWASKSDFTISSGVPTIIYFYYDSSKDDNVDYVGYAGDTAAQNVWKGDLRYNFSQDPSVGDGCIKDSTSNENHATPTGFVSTDLVDSLVGKGLDIDAQNDSLVVDIPVTLSGSFYFGALINIRSYGDEDSLFGTSDYSDGRCALWGNNLLYLTRAGNIVSSVTLSPVFPTSSWEKLSVIRDELDNVMVYIGHIAVGNKSGASGNVGFQKLFKGPDNSGWESLSDAIVGSVDLWVDDYPSASWLKADHYAYIDNLLTFELDLYRYYFSGNVYEVTTSNPVSRIVRVYRRDTGELINNTVSSGTNGAYYVSTTYSGAHYIIALDNDDGVQYNLSSLDRMIPEEIL